MKYTDHALNILTAKTFKNIGNSWIAEHLNYKQDLDVIVDLLSKKTKELVNEKIFQSRKRQIEQKLEAMSNYCDGLVAIGDEKFPNYRGNVSGADRPVALFYKGDLSLLHTDNLAVAVIGLLNPSSHENDYTIENDERTIVDALVRNNATIVSGLALGCDRIAHHQALITTKKLHGHTAGATVGILPCTLAKIIPKECHNIAQYMVENGCLLITEYYEEASSVMEQSSRYVARDRLQAMFSDAVVLTASYTQQSVDPNSKKIDSGSRHAMEKAEAYGIPRAVIYHPKYNNNPKFDLNRQIMGNKKTPTTIINPDNPQPDIMQLLESISLSKSKQKSSTAIAQT
ncbi:DNA-processing protein DprA, partial [Moraxella caviae]